MSAKYELDAITTASAQVAISVTSCLGMVKEVSAWVASKLSPSSTLAVHPAKTCP